MKSADFEITASLQSPRVGRAICNFRDTSIKLTDRATSISEFAAWACTEIRTAHRAYIQQEFEDTMPPHHRMAPSPTYLVRRTEHLQPHSV